MIKNIAKNFLFLEKFNYVFFLIFFFTAFFSVYKLNELNNSHLVINESFNGTPVIIDKPRGEIKGIVFISHGFAGSKTFMKAISLAVVESNYLSIRFDYLGHGKNKKHYTGDVFDENDATMNFINQTNEIIKHYSSEFVKMPIFIVGHSMASDIIFKVASKNPQIEGSVGISNYTNVIKKNKPLNVLILNGQFEPFLRKHSLKSLTKLGISKPIEGITYGDWEDGSARKVEVVDKTGHVSILYSKNTQKYIVDWLNNINGSKGKPTLNSFGFWVLILIVSLLLSFVFSRHFIPKKKITKIYFNSRFLIISFIIGIIIPPFILYFFKLKISSFTAHNHLINHLLIFNIIIYLINCNVIIRNIKLWKDNFSFLFFTYIVTCFILIFGTIIDTFISSFFPTNERLKLFVFLTLTTIPLCSFVYFLSTSKFFSFFYSFFLKFSLIFSLMISNLLLFDTAFLLSYALILLIFFFITFGYLGSYFNKKYSNFLSIGIANGLFLSILLSSAIPLYIP